MSQISNDNVHKGLKTIFSDDNILLALCMVGEKVGKFYLYMSSILQCDSCNGILKHTMDYNVFTFAWVV